MQKTVIAFIHFSRSSTKLKSCDSSVNMGVSSPYFKVSMVQIVVSHTAKRIKFSIKGFFSKWDQIRSFLQIPAVWPHLLKNF